MTSLRRSPVPSIESRLDRVVESFRAYEFIISPMDAALAVMGWEADAEMFFDAVDEPGAVVGRLIRYFAPPGS